MGFDPVAVKIPHVTVNMEAARENVEEFKRYIRVVKEHVQATLKTLPCRALHKRVIII